MADTCILINKKMMMIIILVGLWSVIGGDHKVVKGELERYEQATKPDRSLSFLVVGDWGRNGAYNQSLVADQNDAPTGEAYTSQNQSVAAFVAADMVAFYHCGFFSTHNTLFDAKGRHYYDACYIQGSIDFIFGRARSLFHDCEIFVLVDRRIKIHGSITAHNREGPEEESGYVFNNGKVYGTDLVYLGRAKGAYSRVLFANTYLSGTITPQGWTNWSYDGSTENLFHAEYNCHGPGSSTSERAPWSMRLSEEEAAPFLSVDFIDAKEWLPAWL